MEEPTDKELLNLTLSNLSKGEFLSYLSSRRVLAIYLRWLEIHRQESSKSTYHWPNTLLHWAQALKHRGFGEIELINEVDKWKEANGPFRSYTRRYPPMPREIAKAFEGTPNKQNKLSSEPWVKNLSNFDVPPPKNYICNRCNKGGHHLQVCPTNMDPSYDQPPDKFYICAVCSARGDHYKSLCPKNADPYCLTQKRKAAGIVPPEKRERSDGRSILGEWENDRVQGYENKLCSRSISDSQAVFRKAREMGHLESPSKRKDSVDSGKMERKGMGSDNQSKRTRDESPTKQRGPVKRVRIEDPNGWVGDMDVKEGRAERVTARPTADVHKPAEAKESGTLNENGNSASLQRVIDMYGATLTEVVNPIKHRPTALDMWEQDDLNRLQRMALTTPNRTQSPSSVSDPVSAHESVQENHNESPSGSSSSHYYSPEEAFYEETDEDMDEDNDGRLTPYAEPENDDEDSYTL